MVYFGVNNINILTSLSFKGICLDHSPSTFQCKAKKCKTFYVKKEFTLRNRQEKEFNSNTCLMNDGKAISIVFVADGINA